MPSSLRPFLSTVLFASLSVGLASAAGPEYKVIYRFRGLGHADGFQPFAGLTLDKSGNLYGTAESVFRLSPKPDGAWTEKVLFNFPDPGVTGEDPVDDVTLKDGNVYLTAQGGGGIYGVVLELTPTESGFWNAGVLHTFDPPPPPDGVQPFAGVTFDSSGNLYGDTIQGYYPYQLGIVFQLVPANGSWTENILYAFTGKKNKDGWSPEGDLIFDKAGNIYGTTIYGGIGCGLYGCGTVFELSQQNGVWTEKILYRFKGGSDGNWPTSALVFDKSGNLYGTTAYGGIGSCDTSSTPGCGTVFKLSPRHDGTWQKTILYSPDGSTGGSLFGGVVFDNAGNLYGPMAFYGKAAPQCLAGCGSIFKLAPGKNGVWTPTILHEFDGVNGGEPFGHVTVDAAGNIFGTASYGGYSGPYCKPYGCGVVFEITQ
jgi:uncharacterized repeat protein (TIGR03803 family)